MSEHCNGFSCGTGLGQITLPGDPDNTATIAAVGVLNGIEVSWTYPNLNPNAVIHFRLFRGVTNKPEEALLIRIVSGNFYLDTHVADAVTKYYYWIQIVSVNGTVLPSIGPAFAVALDGIAATIQQLTGKIDAGVLAQALRGEIDRIPNAFAAIDEETAKRLAQNEAMGSALQGVQDDTVQVLTTLNTEIQQRKTENTALVRTVDTLAVRVDETQSSVQTLSQTVASQDSALAQQITQTETSFGDSLSQVQTSLSTSINATNGEVQKIGALYTAKVSVNGLVGGFGIHNDGTEVEAGFDVDRFWVGRTNADKKKPFIIQDGVVYINQACIADGTIDSAKIANLIKSDNFVAGVAGWQILRNGSAEFNNVKVRGDVQADSLKALTDISGATGHFTGRVDIREAQVGTLMIAGQAVTLPISGGRSVQNSTSAIYTSSFTLTETSPVALIFEIDCRAEYPAPSNPATTTGFVNIRRNGVGLKAYPTSRMSPVDDREGMMAMGLERAGCILETLPPGTYSYSMDSAGYFYFAGSLLVIVCKR